MDKYGIFGLSVLVIALGIAIPNHFLSGGQSSKCCQHNISDTLFIPRIDSQKLKEKTLKLINGIQELKNQTGGNCTDRALSALSKCLKKVDDQSKTIEKNSLDCQVIIDGIKTVNSELKGNLTACLKQKKTIEEEKQALINQTILDSAQIKSQKDVIAKLQAQLTVKKKPCLECEVCKECQECKECPIIDCTCDKWIQQIERLQKQLKDLKINLSAAQKKLKDCQIQLAVAIDKPTTDPTDPTSCDDLKSKISDLRTKGIEYLKRVNTDGLPEKKKTKIDNLLKSGEVKLSTVHTSAQLIEGFDWLLSGLVTELSSSVSVVKKADELIKQCLSNYQNVVNKLGECEKKLGL